MRRCDSVSEKDVKRRGWLDGWSLSSNEADTMLGSARSEQGQIGGRILDGRDREGIQALNRFLLGREV
jgi:hypothetical protein